MGISEGEIIVQSIRLPDLIHETIGRKNNHVRHR